MMNIEESVISFIGFDKRQFNRITAEMNRKRPKNMLELTLLVASLGYNASVRYEDEEDEILVINMEQRLRELLEEEYAE